MRLAFVQNFTYEYLGITSISAVVKQAGHETRVFISGWERDLIKSLTLYHPDVIALPTYSGSQGWVFEKAQELKKKLKKLIVLGGPHATFAPEIIKERGIDIVCRGEGEYPMLELLNALEKRKNYTHIKNLWVKKGKKIIKNPLRPLINPLDKLPLADRELYYRYPTLAQNPNKNFNMGRGCPFACAYCHNSGLVKIYGGLGDYVRNYSPNRMIREILQVKRVYPVRTTLFVDDIFITDKDWVNQFLTLYKKQIGLNFGCNVRGGMLTEALAKKMAKSGCISVFLGVETGNEKMRIQLLRKYVTNKSLKKTAKLLHKYHIQLAANNMMCLPGETLDQAVETIKLNAELKVDLPWCSIFQPYPGTEMADFCLKKGFIRKKDLKEIGVTFHKGSIVKSPDINKLINLHKLFHLGVWFPQAIPLLKVLASLPPTPLYDLVFLINQGQTYMKFSKMKPLDFIPHAKLFARLYFSQVQ